MQRRKELSLKGLAIAIFAVLSIFTFLIGFVRTFPDSPLELMVLNATISLSWEDFAIIAMIAGLSGLSVIYIYEARRKSLIDSNLPTLIRDISEAGMLGVTLTRAIEISAERNYGPLTTELRRMIAHLSWKASLSNALQSFAKRCGTSLSKKVALLIQEAHESGGDVQESLEIVNQYVQEYQNQETKRKSEMRPHIVVVYVSLAIFIFTAFMLITQFFSISFEGFGGSQGPETVGDYTKLLFYSSVVQSLFAGLIGGKISTGSIRPGFIHSTILCMISFLAFNLMLPIFG